MYYLLGIDLGTSGTKTVIFDINGCIIASASAEYPLYQPQNGWAEQNPEHWWAAVQQTVAAVLQKSGISAQDIKGIGISGQMHGLVLLDKFGNVLRNSILWCDGRTVQECTEITETVGASRLIEITANTALPGFTAGKILWVRKHEPQLFAKAAHILLPKDYIRYKLTGELATDVSDASGMNLLDIKTRSWSNEILQKLQLDKGLFAKMYESCDITGTVTQQAAKATGLAKGTIVVGGAGDNAASAVGTGVVSSNKAFTTLGTSGVVFAHSDSVKIDPQGRIHTFCAAVPRQYTVMSCTLAAGLSLKWFCNNFCQADIAAAKEKSLDPYFIMDKSAENSPVGANRLLYLPYLMGERSPILDVNARGVFFGLSAMHTKADLWRAVMEGVLFAQRSCLDVFAQMQITPDIMLACGGGGSSPLWRQLMADIYDCPVATAKNKESAALGGAILAGVGAGIYSSVAQGCDATVKYNDAQQPVKQNVKDYTQLYEIYKELYPALKNQFAALAKL